VLVVGGFFVSFLEISCVCLNFLDTAGGQNFQNQLQKNRFSFQISVRNAFLVLDDFVNRRIRTFEIVNTIA
jgi:hypothetical protein